MDKPVRSTACVTAAVLLIAACSSDDGEPYAHESMHPTASEQLFGTTGGSPTATPPSTTPSTTVVTTQPAPTVPSAPLTVPQPVARVSPSDSVFVRDLAASNAAEIELARLAYVRAQSPEVRAFARQLLIDHRDMVIRLDNFALERGHIIAWRIEPDEVATIDRLGAIDSASFDSAYMAEMVSAHETAVERLETQAAGGRETASLANDFLPAVRHHLEMARDLDARL
jgi:putative membrane protein